MHHDQASHIWETMQNFVDGLPKLPPEPKDETMLTNIDAAFAGLPALRDESQLALLGAAAAIYRLVANLEPERVVPQHLINGIFQTLYPWVRKKEDTFPRYFTAQAGKFCGECLYLRCDDKERSVFVMEDGAEVNAGPANRYGACISMAANGSWQELAEVDALEMLEG